MPLHLVVSQAEPRRDLGPRHSVHVAKDQAGAVNGFKPVASRNQTSTEGSHVTAAAPAVSVLLFDVGATPVIDRTVLGNREQPSGQLLNVDAVNGAMQREEHLAGDVFSDISTPHALERVVEDSAGVLRVDLVEPAH